MEVVKRDFKREEILCWWGKWARGKPAAVTRELETLQLVRLDIEQYRCKPTGSGWGETCKQVPSVSLFRTQDGTQANTLHSAFCCLSPLPLPRFLWMFFLNRYCFDQSDARFWMLLVRHQPSRFRSLVKYLVLCSGLDFLPQSCNTSTGHPNLSNQNSC